MVENCGLSGITNIPQSIIINRKGIIGAEKLNGIRKQQSAEPIKENKATRLLPLLIDKYPPITQLIPPIPIIIKDQIGIFRWALELFTK